MRTCLVCKDPLVKRDHESEPRFQKKRFCSAACSRSYFKANKLGWWSRPSFKQRVASNYEKEEQV